MGISSWPLPDEWDDIRLHREFLKTRHTPRTSIPLPDWMAFHKDLKRKGVTKQLLWQEYAERNPHNLQLPTTVSLFQQWPGIQQPSMRQIRGGRKAVY